MFPAVEYSEMWESPSFYRFLCDGIPIGICISDLTGKILKLNRAMAEITGYKEEELKELDAFPYGGGNAEDAKLRAELGESGRVRDREVSLRRKDGSECTALVNIDLVEMNGRRLLLTTARDATGQKRAEAEIRLKERAIASSINAIAMADLGGNLTYVNSSFLYMWGYEDAGEVLGKPAACFWQSEEEAEGIIDVLRAGQGWVGELVAKRKDSTLFDAQMSAHLIRAEDGSPLCLFASFVDTSKLNRAELALRRVESEKAFILDNTREMLLYYDMDLTIRWANKAAADSVVMKQEDLLSRHCYEIWHGRSSPCDGCPVMEAGKTGRPQEREMVTPDGRYWFVKGHPVFGDQGEVIGMIELCLDITGRKRAEAALKDSEEQLRLITDNLPVLIAYVDSELRYRFNNKTYETWLGVPRETIQGKRLEEVIGKRSYQMIAPYVKEALGGKTKIYENAHRFPDGKYRVTRSTVVPHKREDGTVKGMFTLVEDISEQKRAEATLRKSEERFRTLFESAPLGIVITSQDGKFQLANIAFQGMLGYTAEELAHLTYEGVIFPGDVPACREALRAVFMGERDRFHLEKRYIRKDGSVLWGNVVGFRFKGVQDLPSSLIAFVYDISERKLMEEVLRESSQFNQQIVSCAREGVIVYDRYFRCIVWNPFMEELTGCRAGEVMGKRLTEIFPYFEKAGLYDGLKSALLGETVRHTGYSFSIPSTGKEGWASSVQAPLRNVHGEIIGVIENVHDITDRKEGEEKQKKLEEQLYQAQKMESVGRLAGGIAHDFNNLLTSIIGNAELALMSIASQDPVYEEMLEIKKAADRAAELTRQLLAFSRKQIIEPRVLNLNEIITDMDKMLRRLIGETVTLTTLLQEDLRAVKMDPGQVEQVLTNLVVNARDAMSGGGAITIETANVTLDEVYVKQHLGARPGDYVLMAVSDSGIGMDEKVKSHLFEPFFTTKEKGKGTGLGLSTCYGIVKQNSGHIAVVSEPGCGTTVNVYFPAMDAVPESDEARKTGALPRGKETILVVEDEPSVRAMIRRILTGSGYTFVEASSGSEAIELAEEHDGPIHLLLTDVIMPNMGGRELAHTLQARFRHMRVLFMSGYTEDSIVHHGVLDTGIAFIQKPFSPASLTRKVREVLDPQDP